MNVRVNLLAVNQAELPFKRAKKVNVVKIEAIFHGYDLIQLFIT